ncbi:MAG: sterol desaturase family protein [Myxococcota bacterium]
MIRSVVSWGLFPGLLTTGLVATWLGLRAGYDVTPVAMAVVLAGAVPLLIAQRFMPAERNWMAGRKIVSIDLLHMASTAAATESVRAVAMGLVLQAAVVLHGWLGSTLWPTSWPLPVQLAVGIVVGDFGAYWVHRLCHRYPVMWRVHAMHHSSEQMYVFAAARNHPANAILMNAAHLMPLTLLGAPVEIIALTTVFTGLHGMLQHCNVDLRHGWLNQVFSTADLHRWHHSSDYEESNLNFGNNLSIWDTMFGTRYLPEGRPQQVGLGEHRLPENFLAHLASPFVLNRLLRPVESQPEPTEPAPDGPTIIPAA